MKSNRFSPQVRERVVRMVQEHYGDSPQMINSWQRILPLKANKARVEYINSARGLLVLVATSIYFECLKQSRLDQSEHVLGVDETGELHDK